MATKRLWSTLAPSTKAKYKRHGVTPQMYNSVRLRKENADLFKTAQGKAPESYLMQRARELGAREAFPEFNMLPRAEKAKKAEQIIYAQETHKMVCSAFLAFSARGSILNSGKAKKAEQ